MFRIWALGAIFGLLFTGCSGDMQFEKVTGPTSPAAIAWVTAGGLRERLFPGADKAFQLCMEDPQACADVGGYSLQVTPAGHKVLDNFKTLLALGLADPQTDPDFGNACAAFAKQLFDESDADAYEVTMRLLAMVTAEPDSPLQCAVSSLSARWRNEYDSRIVDWDVVKLTGYVELALAGRGLFKARGLGTGQGFLLRTAGRLAVVGGSAVLIYKGAGSTVRTLHLDRWARESARLYFVGTLNWLRKYRDPALLMRRFRRHLTGILDNNAR